MTNHYTLVTRDVELETKIFVSRCLEDENKVLVLMKVFRILILQVFLFLLIIALNISIYDIKVNYFILFTGILCTE